MNELYSLSKQRFRNEITDKELRVKRRKVLEKTFGYRSHLPPKSEANDHSEAKTVVPSAVQVTLDNTDRSNDKIESHTDKNNALKNSDNDSHKEREPTAIKSKEAAIKTNKKPQTASVQASAGQASNETSTKPSSQSKVLPIAAVLIVVVGGAGFYLSQSGDDSQNATNASLLNETNARQVNLDQKFTQLVEKQNYSDDAIAMFLNFYPLASETQKEGFLAELDEKILELDPEISDRLAYLQALISRSENDLVKQTKAILDGAQDNKAFSQLTELWDKATASEKNVFIDYISSTYQDYVVDFDNEQNVLVVDAILNQLNITSSVKSVDIPTSTYANTEVELPVQKAIEEPPSLALMPTETASPQEVKVKVKDIVEDTVQNAQTKTKITVAVAAENLEQASPDPVALKEPVEVQIKDIEPNVPVIVTPVAIVTPPITKVVDVDSAKTDQVPPEASLLIDKPINQVGVNNIELLTAKINNLLAKDSLRNPEDSKVLAQATRALYKLLSQSYVEQGKPNAKKIAKEDTFGIFEQHARFAHHYYDVELFFTERTKNEIKADFKTVDAMKVLGKLFKNAQTPTRPPEA